MQKRVEKHGANSVALQREVERLKTSLSHFRSTQASLIEAAAAEGVKIPFVDTVDDDRLVALAEEAVDSRFPEINFEELEDEYKDDMVSAVTCRQTWRCRLSQDGE